MDDAVRSLLHRLRSWVRFDLDAVMLICPCDLANASAGEAARLCRLLPVYEHFPATEDEYGIASNAVTVLKPDLVEVCCAIDTELAITFPPKSR